MPRCSDYIARKLVASGIKFVVAVAVSFTVPRQSLNLYRKTQEGKNMKSTTAFFVLVFGGTLNVSYAGTTTGTVSQVFVHGYNDIILFNMQSMYSNFASCATTLRYAISTSTQQGKNTLSTILSAKAAGQVITVIGKNSCITHGDAEDINYLYIN